MQFRMRHNVARACIRARRAAGQFAHPRMAPAGSRSAARPCGGAARSWDAARPCGPTGRPGEAQCPAGSLFRHPVAAFLLAFCCHAPIFLRSAAAHLAVERVHAARALHLARAAPGVPGVQHVRAAGRVRAARCVCAPRFETPALVQQGAARCASVLAVYEASEPDRHQARLRASCAPAFCDAPTCRAVNTTAARGSTDPSTPRGRM